MIWLIKHVVDAARRAKRPVSVCQEIVGSPLYTPLLIGLGVCRFSVSPVSILDIKKAKCSISLKEAKAVAATTLSPATVEEIKKVLRSKKQKTP